MTNTDKLGAAVIGCGAISGVHLEIAAKTAKLLCAVDIDPKKAKEAASKYGCSAYTDYREALKDSRVQVVHICTPHYLHAPMAIDAMRSGKHVLTEKPMAITVEDAKKMISVSKETGRKLGVCFQNRYNLPSVKMKELLISGKLGKVLGARAIVSWHREAPYYTESGWRGTWDKEGGSVLINQAIHTLDLLQWLLGEPESIRGSCMISLFENIIETEDTADAVIRFKSGATAVFYATNCHARNSPVQIELVCEKGVMTLEDDLKVQYGNGEYERFSGDNTRPGEKSYWGSSHRSLIKDFYESILTGKKFALEGEQGIKALEMVKSIQRSSELREWVRLETENN